jgi:hypothetical protein
MNAKDIRNWCLVQPRPKKIRATMPDDTQQEIGAPTRSGQSWAQVAQTLDALQPVMLEAFDETGQLLRAKRDDQDDADDGGTEQHQFKVPTNITDPETVRMTHFSNLLANAYRFATETAFGKLAEMFERLDNRSISIEQRLERQEASQRRERQQALDSQWEHMQNMVADPEAPADAKSAIMEAFVTTWLKGQMEKPASSANGATDKPNGKGAATK